MFDREVTIEMTGTDRYGRILGRVRLNGDDINADLLRAGWAWHYTYFNQDPDYACGRTRPLPLPPGSSADGKTLRFRHSEDQILNLVLSPPSPFFELKGKSPMATDWYFSVNGTRRGPVSSKALKELVELGELRPGDQVWKEGMPDWVPAHKVKGLFTSPPPSEPPPLSSRPAFPVAIKTEIPVKVVTPRAGIAQQAAKLIVIGWSLLCLAGVGFGMLNIASSLEPTYNEYEEAGAAIGIGCGLAIWCVIWAVVAVPCLVIWLLTRKT